MNARASVKIITDSSGEPAFVQIPYDQYVALSATNVLPLSVIRAVVAGASPVKAWRKHFGLSQEAVANRMGISQPGYAQHESRAFSSLTTETRRKIANALGISLQQLEL